MPAHRLILVRHSLPEIEPGIPAREWRLSVEGRRRCLPLAQALAPYQLQRVVASSEPKAIQTAQIVAAELDLPMETRPNLHEHERPDAVLSSQQEFYTMVARLFALPDELVLGAETANQARQRFSGAVHALLEEYLDQSLAVVAHGTVISLFVAHTCNLDAFSFWKSLTMPSFVTLSLPDLSLLGSSSLFP